MTRKICGHKLLHSLLAPERLGNQLAEIRGPGGTVTSEAVGEVSTGRADEAARPQQRAFTPRARVVRRHPLAPGPGRGGAAPAPPPALGEPTAPACPAEQGRLAARRGEDGSVLRRAAQGPAAQGEEGRRPPCRGHLPPPGSPARRREKGAAALSCPPRTQQTSAAGAERQRGEEAPPCRPPQPGPGGAARFGCRGGSPPPRSQPSPRGRGRRGRGGGWGRRAARGEGSPLLAYLPSIAMIPGVGRTKWSAGRSGAGGRGGCETGAPGGGGGEGGAAERAGRVTPPHPRPNGGRGTAPSRTPAPSPRPAPPRRVRPGFGKTLIIRQGLWALVAFRGPVPWVFFPELPGGTENRAVKPLYFGQAVVPQTSPELHAPSTCFHVHVGPAALSACTAL